MTTETYLRRKHLLAVVCFAVVASGSLDGYAADPEKVWRSPDPGPAADTLGVPTPLDDPGGKALTRFYDSLRATAAGKKKTRVLLFGASHVAGGSFARVLRHRLQARFGDAGSGFVVPTSPWREYNHSDANIASSEEWTPAFVSSKHGRDDGCYGLAGCSFETRDRKAWVSIETARRSPFGRKVSSYEIFYYKQPGGGDIRVFVDGRRKKTIKTRSARRGPGYTTIKVRDGSHLLKIQPRNRRRVTLFGVALERDEMGVVVDSMGINGARASAQLRWDPAIFSDHLARRDPSLVILAYGTNAVGDTDEPIARYERRLDLVINRMRSFTPNASCVFVGPSDRPFRIREETEDPEEKRYHYLPRPRQAQLIASQRKIAARYGCAHWDWAQAMGGSMSMVDWSASTPRLGSPDHIHMTRRGYEKIAGYFWDALMAGYTDLPPPTSGASPR